MTSKNIRQRIHAVMTELKEVGKSRVNQHHKYAFTPHDDVTNLLHDQFVKHGIDQEVSIVGSARLEGSATLQLEVRLRWYNIDDPKDFKEVHSFGHSTPTGKAKGTDYIAPDDLGPGKALSYAVKIAQLKNFCLIGDGGDLEDDHGKPTAQKEMARVDEVESAMNMLATATDLPAFEAAAKQAAAIADRITPEQSKVMADAWKAAKQRVSQPKSAGEPVPFNVPALEQGESPSKPVEPSGYDADKMAGLMLAYKNVRTQEEFAACRKQVSAALKVCSPAQKQILAEHDSAASKMLQMQREAAQ